MERPRAGTMGIAEYPPVSVGDSAQSRTRCRGCARRRRRRGDGGDNGIPAGPHHEENGEDQDPIQREFLALPHLLYSFVKYELALLNNCRSLGYEFHGSWRSFRNGVKGEEKPSAICPFRHAMPTTNWMFRIRKVFPQDVLRARQGLIAIIVRSVADAQVSAHVWVISGYMACLMLLR